MSNPLSQHDTPAPAAARRRGALAAVLVLVAIAAVALIGRGAGLFAGTPNPAAAAGAPGEMPPMPVDVDTARVESMIDAVRATGRIEAVQAVELRPDEQGRITALLFHEGQAVAEGTPLIRIDDELLRAQADRARAERDLARQQLERVRRLRAENASTPADLERVEANDRGAAAALAVLELQIARSTVRAPFSGIIGQRFVSTGDYVTTASRLLSLQTVDPQRVVIDVPERYASELRLGLPIEFTVAAQPGRIFRARVDFIDPVVQEESRTIMVKASASNGDRALKPGMFIEARLATATRDAAVVVPEDAIQPLRTANIVWAVVDGKANRRVVELGTRARGIVEVLNGIQAGDVVVVGGLERMAEGMPLFPRPRVKGDTLATPESAGRVSG